MKNLRSSGFVLLVLGLAACGGGASVGGPAPVVVPTTSTVATTAPGSTATTPATTSTTSPGATATTTPAGAATPTAAGVAMTTAVPSPASTSPGANAPTTAVPVPNTTATPVANTPVASTPTPGTSPVQATSIGHVMTVVLENENESTTYAANSPATYLNTVVKPAGVFIPNYFATGHVSLDNYISMISGQAPNDDTSGDCQIYQDFTNAGTMANGQAAGAGCVYPTSVPNITDQLNAAGISWRSYNEDMGNDPTRDMTVNGGCGHPTINTQDGTQSAAAPSSSNGNQGDQYATRHNPFMYFHSVIDDEAYCVQHVVSSTKLATDLASVATTPRYSFYTPNLCDDGHDSSCSTGATGGLTGIDAFLKMFVPIVMNSPAFKQDGLLIIIFDEALPTDATSCCNEMAGPTDATPGLSGPGGGDTGAVLISPFITPGSVSMAQYNHYSTLRSIENVFHLPYIGYAGQSGLTAFGSDVYTSRTPSDRFRQVLSRN